MTTKKFKTVAGYLRSEGERFAAIDEWRERQIAKPSRPQSIRWIVHEYLEEQRRRRGAPAPRRRGGGRDDHRQSQDRRNSPPRSPPTVNALRYTDEANRDAMRAHVERLRRELGQAMGLPEDELDRIDREGEEAVNKQIADEVRATGLRSRGGHASAAAGGEAREAMMARPTVAQMRQHIADLVASATRSTTPTSSERPAPTPSASGTAPPTRS